MAAQNFSYMDPIFLNTELCYLGQIFLALVLGSFLGWQRDRSGKPAGIRTYALVAAGSAFFTLLSLYAFGTDSPSRVAAQILVGIGFIGAGTILHKADHIEGLTTAAGLWIAAAIGMGVAAGWYLLSTTTTLLVFIYLLIDEKKWFVKTTNTSLPIKSNRSKKTNEKTG